MDNNVWMLISGSIKTATDSLWNPCYQMTTYDLKVDEGIEREVLLDNLDDLEKKTAELRSLICPHVPDGDSDTVSRLATADAEIAADQAFDRARKVAAPNPAESKKFAQPDRCYRGIPSCGIAGHYCSRSCELSAQYDEPYPVIYNDDRARKVGLPWR